MIAEGLQSVEFIAINTDAKDLMRSDADVKISLNDATSRGLGAGATRRRALKPLRIISLISRNRSRAPIWCS